MPPTVQDPTYASTVQFRHPLDSVFDEGDQMERFAAEVVPKLS